MDKIKKYLNPICNVPQLQLVSLCVFLHVSDSISVDELHSYRSYYHICCVFCEVRANVEEIAV